MKTNNCINKGDIYDLHSELQQWSEATKKLRGNNQKTCNQLKACQFEKHKLFSNRDPLSPILDFPPFAEGIVMREIPNFVYLTAMLMPHTHASFDKLKNKLYEQNKNNGSEFISYTI